MDESGIDVIIDDEIDTEEQVQVDDEVQEPGLPWLSFRPTWEMDDSQYSPS